MVPLPEGQWGATQISVYKCKASSDIPIIIVEGSRRGVERTRRYNSHHTIFHICGIGQTAVNGVRNRQNVAEAHSAKSRVKWYSRRDSEQSFPPASLTLSRCKTLAKKEKSRVKWFSRRDSEQPFPPASLTLSRCKTLAKKEKSRVKWCSRRDSNPGRRLERPVCWAGLHYGSAAPPPGSRAITLIVTQRRGDPRQQPLRQLGFAPGVPFRLPLGDQRQPPSVRRHDFGAVGCHRIGVRQMAACALY